MIKKCEQTDQKGKRKQNRSAGLCTYVDKNVRKCDANKC